MARTPQVSDEAILDAAVRIVRDVGPDGFSLSAVARAVGLTRAAIAFRFDSVRELKRRAVARDMARFAAVFDALELPHPGGDSLLAFADFVASMVSGRARLAAFISYSNASLDDPDIAALEASRGEVMARAMARAMPLDQPHRQNAIKVFAAHLTGSLLAWGGSSEPDVRAFVRGRTMMLLDLLGIAYDRRSGAEPTLQSAIAGSVDG